MSRTSKYSSEPSEHIWLRRAAVAGGIAGLVVTTACGVKEQADKATLSPCVSRAGQADQNKDSFNHQGDGQPISSVPDFAKKMGGIVTTIHNRALSVSGKIDVPNSEDAKVTADSGHLKLLFTRQSDIAGRVSQTDSIVFAFREGEPLMNAASVTCTVGNDIYPNSVASSLTEIAQNTSALGN
jgi:hypothetical protein